MSIIIGVLLVLGSIIGGYVALGGKLGVLWQPFELMIIGGSGVGAFVIANSKETIGQSLSGLGAIFRGPKYTERDYLELLTLLYQVFRLAKTKGMLALEQHVDNPEESSLFAQYPNVVKDRHAIEFLCDYLRLLTLGTDNPHEVEALMDQDLEVQHHQDHQVAHALTQLAEAFPGLGIVAAVLGVIKTMGAITEPPEILGHLIGAALVGTFLGILLCYGFVGPMAAAIRSLRESEQSYLTCMKIGILAHLQGYAPAVSIEFARKALQPHYRPTFKQVEDATLEMPPI